LLVGKFKPALSLERLQGDSDTTFLERAFPTYLASNRDVGIQLHGAFGMPGYKAENVPGPIDAKNAFTYQVGVFNGCGDDCSPNNNAGDINDNKEFVGRLFAHPFQHSGLSWLEGFGFGVAGSLAKPSAVVKAGVVTASTALANQRTPIGRNTYLDYTKLLTGLAPVYVDGDSYRIYPQAYWYAGPFGLMGEYVASSQTLKSGATTVRQDNTAWQVLGSYVLTGEDNSFSAIKPIQNFDPLNGRWGALQLAARWTQFEVDKGTFMIVDPNQSARQATAWTLGLNWYLNNYALVRTDYEEVSFAGGAASGGNRTTEKVFATRFQLSF
jgi:phosphate-selective porin OprO/OprP